MTAREDILRDLTAPKRRGVHWTREGAEQLLARYRAHVLREAADEIVDGCPDHGDSEGDAWVVCHCEAADELTTLADLADPDGATGEEADRA